MKKFTGLVILVIATCFELQAQHAEGNPFARLGYKADVYTFGEKKEFHDQEEIVEIGEVLFNTKTNEVVGFVDDTDSLIELKPELQSMSIDPHCEKYYSISPYAYCMNNPVNAIDPDGRLVIFINGFHSGSGGTKKYWGKNGIFANAVMNHLNDHNPLYRDGSVGGIYNLTNNQDHRERAKYGAKRAKMDADMIIKMITDPNGNIKETIKVITHSMGAAYAKGYLLELQKIFRKLGIPSNVIEFEADFAPYQSGSQFTVVSPTYQFPHNKDNVARNEKMPGAIMMDTESDKKQGHSIMDFYDQISNLPEGRYQIVDGKFVSY